MHTWSNEKLRLAIVSNSSDADDSEPRLQNSDLRVNVVLLYLIKHISRLTSDQREYKSAGPFYPNHPLVDDLQANQKWQSGTTKFLRKFQGFVQGINAKALGNKSECRGFQEIRKGPGMQ